MVILNKIYTRTGDDGTTALANGERRSKADLRIECYGCVDETNAQIGVARTFCDAFPHINDILRTVQNDLFDLGADLATPETDEKTDMPVLRIQDSQVKTLEAMIDHLNQDLQPLRSFILPGGAKVSAHLHVARTLCRRSERILVAAMAEQKESFNPTALRYLNRLSDMLFVAARWCNDKGKADILWQPAKNQ